jgi:CRISPR-associated exonuclease Cas4
MHITATHINYLHICRRKLWLFANGMTMEQNSDLVAEGKIIGESSYPQRAERYTEVEFEGVKIDFYDARNKIVHEVKKSSRMEQAHIAQVKYYLFILERNGIEGAKGVLEYPKLRQTESVELSEQDRLDIPIWEAEVRRIIEQSDCPKVTKIAACKNCSYHDYCFIA